MVCLAKQAGIESVHFPITDKWIPSSLDDVITLVEGSDKQQPTNNQTTINQQTNNNQTTTHATTMYVALTCSFPGCLFVHVCGRLLGWIDEGKAVVVHCNGGKVKNSHHPPQQSHNMADDDADDFLPVFIVSMLLSGTYWDGCGRCSRGVGNGYQGCDCLRPVRLREGGWLFTVICIYYVISSHGFANVPHVIHSFMYVYVYVPLSLCMLWFFS